MRKCLYLSLLFFVTIFSSNANAQSISYSDVKEVTNAWYAVGVLNTADINNLPEFGSLGLIIYPNPANELLNIQGLEMGSKIELYDVMGRLVLQQECNSTTTKQDVEYLTSGVYTLKITTKEGKEVITKVMKE